MDGAIGIYVISVREFLSIVLTSISNVFFLSDSQQSSDAIPPHTQDNKVYTATSHVMGLLAMMVKCDVSRCLGSPGLAHLEMLQTFLCRPSLPIYSCLQ